MESTFRNRLRASLGEHVGAVADVELIFTERSHPINFAGLTNRHLLDPWRLESDALFVEFTDMGLDGLDLRLGRQQIIWGTADKFHPTSNLNPLDVEDPLKFGEAIANEMVTFRYNPDVWAGDEDEPWFSELSLELVFVPFFKPAQLPDSAGLAFTDPDELERQANSVELAGCLELQKQLSDTYTYLYSPRVFLPDREIRNSMYGARLGWNLLGFDMSVSYFSGFDDVPRAEKVVAHIDGPIVDSHINLTYPRVQVLGADLATSLEWLDGVGLWAEVGITFHDDLYRIIEKPHPFNKLVTEKEHARGQFVKTTVGMDYTPVPWWYINVQYLHGFLDEFGGDNLKDYLVAGMDFKLARDKFLFRTFGIYNLQDNSWVLFPQLVLTPFSGGEFQIGSFLFFGDDDSKFGSAVAGRSTLFTKAKVSF